MKEAVKEYIGSKPGTMLVKAKRKKKGLSVSASGTPFELLQVATVLVEEVRLNTGASQKDVVGALLELIYQDDAVL